MKTQEEYALEIDEIVRRDVESRQSDWFKIDKEIWDAYMVYRHMARLHLKKFQYGQVCVVRINPSMLD